MDLKGMLNDGPGGQDGRHSSEEQRARPPHPAATHPPPPPLTGSQPPTPSSYGPPSAQHPSLYAPPSASPMRQPYGQIPTPVKAPSQGPGALQQYPPPPQQAHSPGSAAHYRPYEPSSATTSLARPPSHGYGFPPPSAPQHSAGSSLQARSTSSLSPTPPSNPSPYGARQSPQSARLQGPGQSLPQHQYQHPQPSTPLGPPTFHRHPSGFQDAQSPFHQRNYSVASNGNASGSPAQYPPINAAYSESPSAYTRPPIQQRHSSEYLSRASRERSESVSPKTKVPPRPPSLDSRQSSAPESYSRGASFASNMSSIPGDPQRHVTVPAQAPYTTQQHHHPPPTSEVSQRAPITATATPNSLASASASESSLSQPSRPPPPIHHHSAKMGMNHLLTPTSEVPPVLNGSSSSDAANMAPSYSAPDAAMRPGAAKLHSATTIRQDAQADQQPYSRIKPHESVSEQPRLPVTDSKSALKRSADSEVSGAPPAKQRRMRKYVQPPIWARLSKHNPKFRQQDSQMASAPAPALHQQSREPKNGIGEQSNGHSSAHSAIMDDRPPWTLNPPVDHDLLNAQRVLGKWEKTIKWNTPYPDMLRAVQDWLFQELEQLGDVATDPREGTVEIEAKFGTLMKDGERYHFPVLNACVIHPQAYSKLDLKFESKMTAAEHKHMNDFLNATIQASKQHPGRIELDYLHPYEIDSFHHLSTYGKSLLPQSFQRRQGSRPQRLRITYKDNKNGTRGEIKARIVKLPLSNLHIFNPGNNYDCRISVNLEVNLNRPDVDYDALIDANADAREPPEVDRHKDRIEYKHLAYSIDLTKVEWRGLPASHELELEVNSTLLREQMALMRENKPNAFGDVVAGFLDNATFLMRTRPPP